MMPWARCEPGRGEARKLILTARAANTTAKAMKMISSTFSTMAMINTMRVATRQMPTTGATSRDLG
jgi:hypothetical protein